MVWQMIVGAFAYITVQSAANEAAKVYATTSNVSEAVSASYKIIDSLKHVTVQQNYIQELGNRQFRSVVEIQLSLVFLPTQFLGITMPTIPIELSVDGRKI